MLIVNFLKLTIFSQNFITLMLTPPDILRTLSALDNHPGRLSVNMVRTGVVGARPPTTHPNQPRRSLHINDSYCITQCCKASQKRKTFVPYARLLPCKQCFQCRECQDSKLSCCESCIFCCQAATKETLKTH